MKVTVFGIGYVGLVQAAVLSEAGHQVCCVDINHDKIEQLKQGQIPIYEPGLQKLVSDNYQAGHLQFTTDAKVGVEFGDIQFVAVGTPPDEDGSADLKYVLNVVERIATYSNKNTVVVNKSTVPVGTAAKASQKITEVLEQRNQKHLYIPVLSNPEFLKEGTAVSDCMRPDRIVIGIQPDEKEYVELKSMMRELYEPFNRNHEKILFMDVRSAELTKYAANCMLATKISFMNEVANIAELVGANIEQVRRGIGSDERIGYHFIYPGCGYGGSCFPKDVQALIRTSEQHGYDTQVLRAVENVNFNQKRRLFEKLCDLFNGRENLNGKTFALWGLSFKPKTDDMREAPSRVLMESLWEAGASIQAYDPKAMEEAQRIYGVKGKKLSLMGTKESALCGADALIICTEWQNFKAPDFNLIERELNQPIIVDGRNLFDPERMKQKGFIYRSIGREEATNVAAS
ncbi:UDP-glucose dehydrogenase family protein [Vibrio paucivorans]